jgi:hypothetical protein
LVNHPPESKNYFVEQAGGFNGRSSGVATIG